MIYNDFIYLEVNNAKKEIYNFISSLELYANENNFIITEEHKNFFRFVSKRILFHKEFFILNCNFYSSKVLISDFLNLIVSIIDNRTRYIYLNERSIIENYMRLILVSSLENDHVTMNLFINLKTNFPSVFNEENYSMLRSEYLTACGYIHGGEDLNSDLSSYFNECIASNDLIENRSQHFRRIIAIVKLFEEALLISHHKLIDSTFYNKKFLLELITSKNFVDRLFELRR